jgi:hypothetical protein
MAYFIFLKSLRSLEEFRKNPHVKIPPKSSCANFQSLGIFKNQILFRNHFFLRFRPNRPSPDQPRPEQPWRICQKAPLLRVCAVRQRCFLPRRCQWGPTRQIHPFLAPTDLKHASTRALPQLIAPCLPASITATPIKAPYSPALIPPLESPLTPPHSAINGVGRKSSVVTHQHFHPEHPRPPIKGEHPPPSFTAPLPAAIPLSPRLSNTLTEHRRRRTFTAIARPPRCSSTSGEALDRIPASSSCFPSGRGELSWNGALVGRALVSSSGQRRRPVHGGPESRWSTARGPSSRVF